ADGFLGWTRQNTNVEQPGIGENLGLNVLGIPGTNGSQRFQSGWPRFVVDGFANFGTEEPWTPYYRNDNQYSFRGNFTKTKTAHEIRWGIDINSEQMNHTQPEFQGGSDMGARGRFNFTAGTTSACLVPSGTGTCRQVSPTVTQANAFGSYLLGLPSTFGKNQLNVFPYTTRNTRYSLYVRDRWQVSKKLTVSYGVRWEYFPMPTRADRGFERYDPETNKMQIGGVGSVPENLGVQVSKKLFAPRFGVAYRATDTLVVRAGYGISYDPYSLSRPLRTNHPILIELVVPSATSLMPAGRLADGIPTIPVPDLGNGIIDAPSNVSTQTIPLKLDRGYIQSWNFMIQKRLAWGFVGEAGYVATRQTRQLGYRQLNWAPIGGGTAGQQLTRKFGRTANTREVSPIGGSHYDSLQATLQRRFAGGYSLYLGYTWGKSITNSGSDVSDGNIPINIPEYYGLNRSVNSFDRPHNLQITNIVELPFGPGKQWVNSAGMLSKIVGGWQANSLISLMSGRPFSVSAAGTSLNAPFSSQRADQVKPEVQKLGGVGRGEPFFDPMAFAAVNEPRFGTAGFNSLRGPGRINWDFGLFRHFRLSEKL
ncbi:MAG TPA: TonB-dependent receptor, partial [Terriglobales bacterium]